VLREKALPYMLEHADYLEQHLERHGPDEATVRLSPANDVCRWTECQPAIAKRRDRWDVWRDRHTGEGRLRRRTW
jgi:hypothetical protein